MIFGVGLTFDEFTRFFNISPPFFWAGFVALVRLVSFPVSYIFLIKSSLFFLLILHFLFSTFSIFQFFFL